MQPRAEPPPDDRDSAYELFQRGSRLLADRHPGAAAVLLERALALEPGKASILEALGQAYFNQGDHASAADRFGAIVEADARAARRHLRMAVFLKPESDDYQRALARLGDAA